MQIEVVTQADQKLWDAFQRLVPQLTSNNPPPSRDDLAALVKSESSTLIIARADDGSIIGAASLTVYRVPTGMRAIIEDVIVDESARGRGIGEALVRRCLELARKKGAGGVALTSNPKREAANRLYVRMGFVYRETNAYYYKF
ncbi:MAG: GNAT family N-acetyltransferase [Chloroflexi bacterium]|nr:GNAT family N-acetyltransferase [Chloroflexota bacterium]MBI3338856.1 GNAT family N-acetyltransferase [Chloroflexota bacterium]